MRRSRSSPSPSGGEVRSGRGAEGERRTRAFSCHSWTRCLAIMMMFVGVFAIALTFPMILEMKERIVTLQEDPMEHLDMDRAESSDDSGFIRSVHYNLSREPFASHLLGGGMKYYGVELRFMVWVGENLCYDSVQNKFVFGDGDGSRNVTKPLISGMNYEIRRIPKSLVSSWVMGITAVTPGYRIHESGAHFHFWALPAFHLIQFAMKYLSPHSRSAFNVAFDNTEIPPVQRQIETELFEVMFGKLNERISLSKLQGLVCFEKALYVQRPGVGDVKNVAFPADVKALKQAYAAKYNSTRMIQDCADPDANHKTIWLSQRRVWSRKIANLEEMKQMIERVFGPQWNVVDFDSANVACADSPLGKGCLGFYNCESGSLVETCERTRQLKWEVELFQNMTFLISVHGATLMHLPWIPERSHIVEIFPVGIRENCYQEYCKRANLNYFRYEETNRTAYDLRYKHIPPEACFSNNDCRRDVKAAEVYISTHALEKVLIMARNSYLASCHQSRASPR